MDFGSCSEDSAPLQATTAYNQDNPRCLQRNMRAWTSTTSVGTPKIQGPSQTGREGSCKPSALQSTGPKADPPLQHAEHSAAHLRWRCCPLCSLWSKSRGVIMVTTGDGLMPTKMMQRVISAGHRSIFRNRFCVPGRRTNSLLSKDAQHNHTRRVALSGRIIKPCFPHIAKHLMWYFPAARTRTS